MRFRDAQIRASADLSLVNSGYSVRDSEIDGDSGISLEVTYVPLQRITGDEPEGPVVTVKLNLDFANEAEREDFCGKIQEMAPDAVSLCVSIPRNKFIAGLVDARILA